MLALLLLLGVLAALFYHVAVRPMSHWKKLGVLQGNPVWLFGDHLGPFLRTQSFAGLIEELYNRFPNVRYHGVYQFLVPTLLIRDPALLKQITVKDFDYFADHRTFVPENSDPLMGKNLFSLKGQKWRDMRPVLSPAFTSSKMRSMFVLMSDCAERFVQHFSKRPQKVIDVEMKDILTRYGNDTIATTAFGIQVDSLTEPNNYFYIMGKELTDFSGIMKNLKFFGYMMVPKLYEIFKISFINGKVRQFFIDLVEDSIKAREEKGIVRPDMIHLMVEARKGKLKSEKKEIVIDTGFAAVEETDMGPAVKATEITNMDIAAHAMVFFFGGFDSAATLMCFMAQELAANPDIQDRLRQEIETTLKDCGGKLTYEGLMKMKYMDMVVSETLRKWPNGVVADRICTKPFTLEPSGPDENPLLIEKGTVIWIPVYGIHMDPQYYPDPEKFDPERFSDRNKDKIDPYTYIPFGLGPRNCIGSRFALLEAKVLFFHLLLNFEIVPTEKTKIPWTLSKTSIQMAIEGGSNLGLKRVTK